MMVSVSICLLNVYTILSLTLVKYYIINLIKIRDFTKNITFTNGQGVF